MIINSLGKYCISLLFLVFVISCSSQTNKEKASLTTSKQNSAKPDTNLSIPFNSECKTIHTIVALCDNKYQGIVPVPASIGNGQNPQSNLYWGAAYGIKTFFKKSAEWSFISAQKMDSVILERLLFKHKKKEVYFIADAYNGKYIKEATTHFFEYAHGYKKDTLHVNDKVIDIAGGSSLLSYIGHDGLMDFSIHDVFTPQDTLKRSIISLACYSQHYFSTHLEKEHILPLVWTSGLMAPEAYTLHDALTGYVNNETPEQIRERAAKAYSTYQKCSIKAAKNLLVSGF